MTSNIEETIGRVNYLVIVTFAAMDKQTKVYH